MDGIGDGCVVVEESDSGVDDLWFRERRVCLRSCLRASFKEFLKLGVGDVDGSISKDSRGCSGELIWM